MPSLSRGAKAAIGVGVVLGGAALLLGVNQALAKPSSSYFPPANAIANSVTPNGPLDGGGFGPSTPGSTTCGIQECIDQYRKAVVYNGNYPMPPSFSGIYVRQWAEEIQMDSNTVLMYPNGYAGPVIQLDDSVTSISRVRISGGAFMEAGLESTWKKRAVGYRLVSNNVHGIFDCAIRDTFIWDNDIGLSLDTSGSGFVNNNLFENITLWHPQSFGMRFSRLCNQNLATQILVEMAVGYAGPNLIAFDIDGVRNVFDNCAPEDAGGNMSNCRIESTAQVTVINGGSMDSYRFQNFSPFGQTIINGKPV